MSVAKEKQTFLSTTKKMDHRTAYLLCAPALILLTIFVYLPLVLAIEKSFTDWKFYGDSTFIGLDNFGMVLKNQLFQQSIGNILWFVVMIIPAEIILGFFLAHVLKHMSDRLGAFVKTSIYVPTVIAGVVASVIFLFISTIRAALSITWSARLAESALRFSTVRGQPDCVLPLRHCGWDWGTMRW